MNILEYIKANLATGDIDDVREGTAVRDIAIKPHILLMNPLLVEIDRVKLAQSMKNYNIISNEEMDLLVANILLARKTGDYAFGTVRFLFKSPVSVIIPGTTEIEYNDMTYLLTEDINITAPQMQYNIDGQYFYVDGVIQSLEKNSDYNIEDPGQIMNTKYSHPEFIRCENTTGLVGAISEETNEELYFASQRAVGERTLTRDDGAYTIITRAFPEVLRMQVIGYGDPEMERDILHGAYEGMHVGGKVDHYVDTAAKGYVSKQFLNVPSQIVIQKAEEGDDATYMITDTPVINIRTIEEIDPLTFEPTGTYLERGPDYSIVVNKIDENYSVWQSNVLTFSTDHLGKSFRIYYDVNPTIQELQDFVYSRKYRQNNADHWVFNLLPATLDIIFNYSGKGTEAQVIQAISSYIQNNLRYSIRWETSDLVDYLYNTEYVDYIELPMTINITESNKAGTETLVPVITEHEIERLGIFYVGNIAPSKI